MVTGRIDPELGVQKTQELLFRLLPATEGSVALNIGVSTYRARSCTRLPEVSLQEQQFTLSLMVSTECGCCV